MSEYKNIEGMESLSEEQAEQVVGGASDTYNVAPAAPAHASYVDMGYGQPAAATVDETAQLEGTTSSTDSLITDKLMNADCITSGSAANAL